ncbi:glycosyltransferase family 2 protein [Leptolyngbya cf. ectocarpi LEGE 11479]|uniref:Glycosyltransferase family 2 protein n=1 Tax=Leptolyngbya cf. ectocarpi LEGE 11479 TaxID=1828722 RepID=A0A928ZTP0_LEPEC|nr:glycosyltransferase family A protein [Leptolyngbya ectocarpi]MBE9066479.1 glycosyltransferase family 2 protein [Leptolyngbya cf. ectocarpi LEGE 11479]
MKSENPLVSVIIPAYNAEHFIERTIISVLNQTYRNLEIIVVDDGSCDRTAEIVRAMAGQDQRIVLLQQTNGGVAAARNTGIRHAKGDFIAPLDADDIWYPENIVKQLNCFQKTGKPLGLCYAWTVDIDDDDHLLRNFRAARIKGSVARTLLCHNFLGNASASLIRRECFDAVGGYDDSFHQKQIQGCEDWDLYLRIAEKYAFDVVPEFLIGYRRTPESMSSKDTVKMAQSHSYMLKKTSLRRKDDLSLCYRLSKSSFYMYLARQSYLNGNPNRTVKWLLTALQLDPITIPFRYGFYLLLFKGLISTGPDSVSSLLNYITSLLVGPCRFFRKADSSPVISKPPTIRIQFKLLIGNTFHNLISRYSQQNSKSETLSPKAIGLQASIK